MIKEELSPNYDEIYKIWLESVKATHSFLKDEDLDYINGIIKDIFPQVKEYILYYNEEELVGFIGVNNPDIEMFFLKPKYMGQKIGYQMVEYLKNKHAMLKIDVNKQNKNAYRAYLSYGFKVIGESAKDSLNLNYPILHMQWNK